ncbi:MAG: DNA polymerase III subunit epsilon, partial [Rhodobacter sp.]|nr:DNA polymerase III subunit epsilon [Rhodobacter sp.]
FLNAELAWAGLPVLAADRAVDTLLIARKRFPGAPASLDALCRRFGVDNSSREYHGALLDSRILAEVYLELVGGRQPDLVLSGPAGEKPDTASGTAWRPGPRPRPLSPRITQTEEAAHAAFVAALGQAALWSERV